MIFHTGGEGPENWTSTTRSSWFIATSPSNMRIYFPSTFVIFHYETKSEYACGGIKISLLTSCGSAICGCRMTSVTGGGGVKIDCNCTPIYLRWALVARRKYRPDSRDMDMILLGWSEKGCLSVFMLHAVWRDCFLLSAGIQVVANLGKVGDDLELRDKCILWKNEPHNRPVTSIQNGR